MEIPLKSLIRAGKPIEAIETVDEYVNIVREPILKGNLYALKVEGDSMIDEGIFDGDIVIAKKQSVADNGDTVVAVINDNEATSKKFYVENGKIKLQPANSKYKPIYRKRLMFKVWSCKLLGI